METQTRLSRHNTQPFCHGPVYFRLALWHITHCRLFHTKSCLYIYIEHI